MKAKVKKEGLLIPKKLLKGITEAEIKWMKGKIIVEPIKIEDDPIFTLGSHPGRSGLKDVLFIMINTFMKGINGAYVSGYLFYHCPRKCR